MAVDNEEAETRAAILEVVRRTWGYDSLRPLQEEAVRAGLEGRDSVVVLPTGGGKSLCYQVPPVLAGRTDIVVSPLISLMKDQVDGLLANGYPAAALHSAQTAAERADAERFIASGDCHLVFVSPERLVTSWFLQTVENLGINTFSVDEAHCISQWGHDFRPEYRQLAVLKQRVPGATIHAFTATATERVREDIVEQLGLEDPTMLVGRFDRPNLIYRLIPRLDTNDQVSEVLSRHQGEAAIIYCISRKDTEKLAEKLAADGHRAACYHAGLESGERHRTQEAFSTEQLDIVVATVAFGMGIDRSDVRCIIHAAMPKSVEHYQQETGRAGRDGLSAECVLLHSPADALKWRTVLERGAAESGENGEGLEGSLRLLDGMRRYCSPGRCRHRVLSEYFGQTYEPPRRGDPATDGAVSAPGAATNPQDPDGCGACDVCLGETEGLVDGIRDAQMILSCVARVEQRYGMGHVVDVLRGADTERIRSLRHDELSTWGLMKDRDRKEVMNLTFQLLDQDLLARSEGEYPVLCLNQASVEVMRGERRVQLVPIRVKRARTTAREAASWEGVDRALFDSLRELRTELARRRDVPPYVIFSDASLRDMARKRPATSEEFLDVHGVGDKKLADFGDAFLARIRDHVGSAAAAGLDDPGGPGDPPPDLFETG
ncbi:MAG: RecQ family ATP-dependent DNA helicase [Acidobacteria bacterium]|nr:RecQ family ATP-dependent DNA helicase [Acidobacteriota bacterium]